LLEAHSRAGDEFGFDTLAIHVGAFTLELSRWSFHVGAFTVGFQLGNAKMESVACLESVAGLECSRNLGQMFAVVVSDSI
jgi:hypothetical protein